MKTSKVIEEGMKKVVYQSRFDKGDCIHCGKHLAEHRQAVVEAYAEMLFKAREAQKAELVKKAREYQEKIQGGGNGRRIMEEFINLITNN